MVFAFDFPTLMAKESLVAVKMSSLMTEHLGDTKWPFLCTLALYPEMNSQIFDLEKPYYG